MAMCHFGLELKDDWISCQWAQNNWKLNRSLLKKNVHVRWTVCGIIASVSKHWQQRRELDKDHKHTWRKSRQWAKRPRAKRQRGEWSCSGKSRTDRVMWQRFSRLKLIFKSGESRRSRTSDSSASAVWCLIKCRVDLSEDSGVGYVFTRRLQSRSFISEHIYQSEGLHRISSAK